MAKTNRELFYLLYKVFRKIESVVRRFSKKYYGYYLKTLFKIDNNQNKSLYINWTRISGNNLQNEFDYKDETWNFISFLPQLLQIEYFESQNLPVKNNSCNNDRVKFDSKHIKIFSKRGKPRRWIFMPYTGETGNIYAIDCNLTIFSNFTEIQFGFNYETITKRLRFMIVNNKELVFEVVEKGWFYRPIKPIPVTLDFGKEYHIRIEVVKNVFKFYLDGNLMLSVFAYYHQAKIYHKFVLIFFDAGSKSDINLELNDFKIYKGNL